MRGKQPPRRTSSGQGKRVVLSHPKRTSDGDKRVVLWHPERTSRGWDKLARSRTVSARGKPGAKQALRRISNGQGNLGIAAVLEIMHVKPWQATQRKPFSICGTDPMR